MIAMKSAEGGETNTAGNSQIHDAPPVGGDMKKDNMFDDENLARDSIVEPDKSPDVSLSGENSEDIKVTITPEDKVNFLDAVVHNARFTKDYSLFAGKVTFTLRSLTADEVNALAAWTVKQGTKDSAGMLSGRYRKYLVAAQVARLNGVDMPPLESPLFEHLGSDGKTVEPPGWTNRCDFYDGMGFGYFQAILRCISDFDIIYSTLCSKAEDVNFWNPDTP